MSVEKAINEADKLVNLIVLTIIVAILAVAAAYAWEFLFSEEHRARPAINRPTPTVQINERTFTMTDLVSEQLANPNILGARTGTFEVDAIVSEVLPFDEVSDGFGYRIPLEATSIDSIQELEHDFRNLSYSELEAKYGEDVASRVNGWLVGSYPAAAAEVAETPPFRAEIHLEGFDIRKAASLRKGQRLKAVCREIALTPLDATFWGCTVR